MKETHPHAEIFPAMTDSEFARLADDVESHGLLEPIVLLNGLILDGRHRERACEERGVEPRYEEWDESCGVSALEWVISKNLHRRQLTKAQRAALAVECEAQLAEAGRARQVAGGKESGRGRPQQVLTNSGEPIRSRQDYISRMSSEIAGRAFGVHRNTVIALKAVRKRDEEAFQDVKEGRASVEGARRQAGLGPSSGTGRAKKVPLKEALAPLRVYLKNWTPERLGVMTPREASRLLTQVQEIDNGLFEVERALEERSVKSRALA